MNKEEFMQYKQNNIIFLDGATGSNLFKRGMPRNVCIEKWLCDNPEILCKLQKEYLDAGSQIIYAPTFGANRVRLSEFGLENELYDINRKLVGITKSIVNGRSLVAGDITMTGKPLKPIGDMSFDTLVDIYKEQIKALTDAGTDVIVIETMLDVRETRAAIIAAKETCDSAVFVTHTITGGGNTLYGTDVETSVYIAERLGAAAAGINCSEGPDKLTGIVEKMAYAVNIPIIVKPNAGIPDNNNEYSMGAVEFTEYMKKLVACGADIIGGCCGTEPDHIRKLKEEIADNVRNRAIEKRTGKYISGGRKTIEIDNNSDIRMIKGTEDADDIVDVLDDLSDEGCDAAVIDLDMFETEKMKNVLTELYEEVGIGGGIPWIFKGGNNEIVEFALRHYPGIAGVIDEKNDRKEIINKYGAVVLF